jgi:hypothetical protein
MRLSPLHCMHVSYDDVHLDYTKLLVASHAAVWQEASSPLTTVNLMASLTGLQCGKSYLINEH